MVSVEGLKQKIFVFTHFSNLIMLNTLNIMIKAHLFLKLISETGFDAFFEICGPFQVIPSKADDTKVLHTRKFPLQSHKKKR